MSYTPSDDVLDATWVGAAFYVAPYGVVGAAWDAVLRVSTPGISAGAVGTPPLVTQQQFVSPAGITNAVYGTALVTLAGQYIPPYATLNASWVGALTYTPDDDVLDVQWVDGVIPGDITVYPTGFDSSAFGNTLIWTYQYADPSGFDNSVFGRTRIARDGDYLPYVDVLDASWVGAPYYAPRDDVLEVGWYPTTGPRKLLPFGWVSDRIGTIDVVRNAYEYVLPGGIVSLEIGTASVVLSTQYATPTGLVATSYGQPTIANRNFNVYTGGLNSTAYGTPMVSYRNRALLPLGVGAPSNQLPGATVTHIIQYVDLAGRSIVPAVYGAPSIAYFDREIFPVFISSQIFGITNVARIQVIAPSSWESSEVESGLRVDINLQRLFPDSGATDPAEYGATSVRNQHEIIAPTGWLSQEINFPVLYNLDQYVLVSPYMDTNSDPTQWPSYYPFVENKDRYLGPGGFQSSRFSVIGSVIENKAVPVYPAGIDSLAFGSTTFVSHYTRYVTPEAWDSFTSTQYSVVHNDAIVLSAQGWSSSAVGRPDPVLNLNRTVKHVFPYGGETFGTAFIADAVRSIAPGVFKDQAPSIPEVRHNPYPIAPASINPPQFGATYVEERFTVIYPMPTNVHSTEWVGEPIVENRNKTLRVAPSDQLLFGLAKTFNYMQTSEIGGGDLLRIGAHLISYRTKVVTAAPTTTPVFTVLHRIRNDIPDPPAPQGVYPPGIVWASDLMPIPRVSTNNVQVPSIGAASSVFGNAQLTRNTIAPLGIYDDGMVGTPAFPGPDRMYVQSFNTDKVAQVPEGARLSPHHVYAPLGLEAPAGYTPSNQGQFVNSEAVFGVSVISLKNRIIGPIPDSALSPINRPTLWGDATIDLFRRYVRPRGFNSLRMPPPVLWGAPQYVRLGGDWDPPGIDSMVFSDSHAVAHYVAPEANPVVRPQGVSAIFFGANRVELRDRPIFPVGIPHRGNPEQSLTNPWGDALVGYPRRYAVGMGSQTLWGAAVIEYKNRTYQAVGWVSNSMETYDVTDLLEPMRVTQRNAAGGLPGISPGEFGRPIVELSNRTIYTRSFRGYAPSSPIVNNVNVLVLAGWDSLAVGNIDRWEAGKVKPHGDDLNVFGTPRMVFRVAAPSATDFEFPEPSMGRIIYAAGMPPIGFDGPSVTDPYGCSTRVVSPYPITSPVVYEPDVEFA